MHPKHILQIFDSLHLFKNKSNFKFGNIIPHENSTNTGLFSLFDSREEIFYLSKGEISQIALMGNGVNYDFPTPLLRFMTENSDEKKIIQNISSNINWNRSILSSLNQIETKFNLHTCTSVHIRRGDIIKMLLTSDLMTLAKGLMIQIIQRYTPLQAYFQAVDQQKSSLIVVCTEDFSIVEKFCQRYGRQRVISSLDLNLNENQRAVTDILLLSKSERIIAPVISYFSQCAASIGNTVLSKMTWNLEETSDEIEGILNEIGGEHTKQIASIMYASCYMICIKNNIEEKRDFKELSVRLDSRFFEIVTRES